MSLRALLLSPDDQAVNVITSVLEEMSVSCDRPLDGATAAKKLNSEHFDLVVVDCDNLPAAKLIFDVCRRSHGATSVPVAVVDGRVGLPTAFRLGAELILTKPVAKDQAKLTIRTAVSRTKKDQPAHDAKAADVTAAIAVEKQENTVPKALAAAAGAASSGNTQSTTAVGATAAVSVQPPAAANAETHVAAVVADTVASVKGSVITASTLPASRVVSRAIVPAVTSVSSSETKALSTSATLTSSSEEQLSEDPVMAALANDEPVQKSPTFSSLEKPKPDRSRGLWIGTLLLAVLGGAGYAGWMYQPGLRKFIELRIDQAKTLSGFQRTTSTDRPVAPTAAAKKPLAQQPAPQIVPSPAPQNSTAEAPSATDNTLAAPSTPAANTAVAAGPGNVESTSSVAAQVPSNNSAPTEPEKKIAEQPAQARDFPEIKTAVILSSKGAEKRLVHRVKPVVTAEARARSAEATVVLKALIDENGFVKALQPVEGSATITGPAMRAVKQWRYKPYTRDGKALPFQTIVLVDLQ